MKFVVFGVLGPVLLGLIYFVVMRQAATVATDGLSVSMQRQSAAAPERAGVRQEEVRRRKEEAQRAQLEASAARAREQASAALIEQQEAARKAAAWGAYFKPKRVCDNPPDFDTQVECGNAHIRAKREFEERWARGELR